MQRPLDYRGTDPVAGPPPRSGLHKGLSLVGGLVAGFPVGIGLMIGIGSLLPNGGRAQTEKQAGVALFVGLAVAGGGFVPLAWGRWFFAGLAIGAGLGAAVMAFFIGVMSGIT